MHNRSPGHQRWPWPHPSEELEEARQEIARLRGQRDRLREAVVNLNTALAYELVRDASPFSAQEMELNQVEGLQPGDLTGA